MSSRYSRNIKITGSLSAAIGSEVRRLVNQSASLRVGSSRWSVPECTAEIDVAKGIRVHISICVRFSAGAVEGVTGELAVPDVAVVGLDGGLA